MRLKTYFVLAVAVVALSVVTTRNAYAGDYGWCCAEYGCPDIGGYLCEDDCTRAEAECECECMVEWDGHPALEAECEWACCATESNCMDCCTFNNC